MHQVAQVGIVEVEVRNEPLPIGARAATIASVRRSRRSGKMGRGKVCCAVAEVANHPRHQDGYERTVHLWDVELLALIAGHHCGSPALLFLIPYWTPGKVPRLKSSQVRNKPVTGSIGPWVCWSELLECVCLFLASCLPDDAIATATRPPTANRQRNRTIPRAQPQNPRPATRHTPPSLPIRRGEVRTHTTLHHERRQY